ncbi:MAG: hypothetical protein WAQ52_17445 [Terriglobales bacterium]
MTSSHTCCGRKPPAQVERKYAHRLKSGMAATAILLLSHQLLAGGSHKHSKQTTPLDPGYVFALATANRFLHAWQTGDLETGMVLLSDRVRHSQNPEKFEQFFSGSSDRAFEIARGQRNRGRYRFGVVLVTSEGARIRRRFSEIIVVNTGKNDWAVDKLP